MAFSPKIILQLPLSSEGLLDAFVEDCIKDGVVAIAVVGKGSSRIEDVIDELIVGDGSGTSRFITTTSHENEPMEEVVEFVQQCMGEEGQLAQLVKL